MNYYKKWNRKKGQGSRKEATPRKCPSYIIAWISLSLGLKIHLVTHSFGRAGRRSIYHRPLCHCLIFGCLITLVIMYLLIVFLPLLGSSVAGFFGRFLGSEGTAIMTTTCVSFSSILSLIAFYEVAPGASACYLRIAPWISSEMFDASWGFFGDREVTG
ncbi:hypothetical protein CsSME_00054664 [Camellia sinensis var. sinensis]